MRRESADWLTPSAAAASVTPPRSATASRERIRSRSMHAYYALNRCKLIVRRIDSDTLVSLLPTQSREARWRAPLGGPQIRIIQASSRLPEPDVGQTGILSQPIHSATSTRGFTMLDNYRKHVAERAEEGIVPRPLDTAQTKALTELLLAPPSGEGDFLLELLTERVPPGVDAASWVKADFLTKVANAELKCPLLTPERAVELLGTMLGGYNVEPLVLLLTHPTLGALAATQLSQVLLVATEFDTVAKLAKGGNANAQRVLQSWADGEWFSSKKPLAKQITLTVFKVPGETNTDDLSPAQDAWSRPDIPLHALAMLKNPREGITNALAQIEELKRKGHPLTYVGDVVGTGSSRKSATNSVLWHTGDDIPCVPNKRTGGVVLGGKIAPIFFNTMEDSGALPIECDVSKLKMGDVITVYPYDGKIENEAGEVVSEFAHRTDVLLDEVQAGGRIPLIIGRTLTDRARKELKLGPASLFRMPPVPPDTGKGYTLAQKVVGRA